MRLKKLIARQLYLLRIKSVCFNYFILHLMFVYCTVDAMVHLVCFLDSCVRRTVNDDYDHRAHSYWQTTEFFWCHRISVFPRNFAESFVQLS